jgi:hypothetical protein
LGPDILSANNHYAAKRHASREGVKLVCNLRSKRIQTQTPPQRDFQMRESTSRYLKVLATHRSTNHSPHFSRSDASRARESDVSVDAMAWRAEEATFFSRNFQCLLTRAEECRMAKSDLYGTTAPVFNFEIREN